MPTDPLRSILEKWSDNLLREVLGKLDACNFQRLHPLAWAVRFEIARREATQ